MLIKELYDVSYEFSGDFTTEDEQDLNTLVEDAIEWLESKYGPDTVLAVSEVAVDDDGAFVLIQYIINTKTLGKSDFIKLRRNDTNKVSLKNKRRLLSLPVSGEL